MYAYLQNVRPGTHFRLVGMNKITGELVRCSECSAVVRLDGGVRDVEQHSALRASTKYWAPTTVVEPILNPEDQPSSQQLEHSMMAKKKTPRKKPEPAATKPARAKSKPEPGSMPETKSTPKPEPKPEKLSALDAAAKVLGESKEPLTTAQMIEAMATKGYWTSPGGKTPHATLYSAILREMKTKGKEARFKKADRGKFALA